MKEIVALLFLICIVVVTLYLATTLQIDLKAATIFFGVAIVGGFVIANYDFVKKFKWKGLELETFRGEVASVKKEALDEIRIEVATQQDAVKLLIANANDIREKIEIQKVAVESLLDRAQAAEDRLTKVASGVEESRRRIEQLHRASSDLALLLTKITWLQVETKSEFGTERATLAIQQMLADLNRVVGVVIPDEGERTKWIQQLKQSLPERK